MSARALVEAVAELAAVATQSFTPDDLLKRLAEVAAQHLDVDGIGVMVVEDEAVRFVHASHDGVLAVEQLQQLMQEGPCRDAMRGGADVVVEDLADPAQTTWPDFVERALEAGLGSVVAVPLLSRGRTWGVLDLYRFRAGPWAQEDLESAHLLAHVAVSYLVMAADRDQARRAEQDLAHRSTHDALTGLPNRTLLFDRLEHALQVARRHRRVVAVFFIDLDRFKAVNDTFGHAAGDTVLATVATRMNATLRSEDTLARLAGDEFVLLCEELPQADAAELEQHVQAVSTRLHRALAQPIRVGGVELVVRASIGVAISDDQQGDGQPGDDQHGDDQHGDDQHGGGPRSAEDLLSDADRAMYRAKHHERGAHGDLSASEGERPARRSARQLERQLAQALPRGQLRVHYQPIVDQAGTVHAVEALLRWQHPQHGLLPAGEFIDLATGNGLVVGIGQWVIAQTCEQMEHWEHEVGRGAPQTAYVNLDARELVDPALTSTITTALREHHLHPEQLGLELLESSFIDPQVLPSLHEQQRRGHPLSVDDFGTGYSSLSRLVDLPVRMAKIDRSFVAALGHDPRPRALVEAVVTVAESLDLRVVAEGVETAEQAGQVADAGCHYLQGFHCGHPQSGESLSEVLGATPAARC